MISDEWLYGIVETVDQMINAHLLAFGKRPTEIILQGPELSILGVPIKFREGPRYVSRDAVNVLHHDLKTFESN